MAQRASFNKCTYYGAKMTQNDECGICLFLLGKGHNVSACKTCQYFTPKARGYQASKLKVTLWGKALKSSNLLNLALALEALLRPLSSISTRSALSVPYSESYCNCLKSWSLHTQRFFSEPPAKSPKLKIKHKEKHKSESTHCTPVQVPNLMRLPIGYLLCRHTYPSSGPSTFSLFALVARGPRLGALEPWSM